jgi:phage shock protein PspC (stress-responsive transcriptional regulator)
VSDEQSDQASIQTPAEAPEQSPPPASDEPLLQGPTPSAAHDIRRLRRSRDDRVIAGVCGGVAEYFGIDAVLVRIAALILVFAGGAGIILYIIGWIAMPEARVATAGGSASPEVASLPGERTTSSIVIGALFVLLGAFFLLDKVWPDFLSWQYVWPIALIAVGIAVILRARQ